MEQVNAGTFTQRTSIDLDHYRAQPGNWNVSVSQLMRGEFRSNVRSIEFPDLIFYNNRWVHAGGGNRNINHDTGKKQHKKLFQP